MRWGNKAWCNLNHVICEQAASLAREQAFSSQRSPNPQEAFCFEIEPQREHYLFLHLSSSLLTTPYSWKKQKYGRNYWFLGRSRENLICFSAVCISSLSVAERDAMLLHAGCSSGAWLGTISHWPNRSWSYPLGEWYGLGALCTAWVLGWMWKEVWGIPVTYPFFWKDGDCVSRARVLARSSRHAASGHSTSACLPWAPKLRGLISVQSRSHHHSHLLLI